MRCTSSLFVAMVVAGSAALAAGWKLDAPVQGRRLLNTAAPAASLRAKQCDWIAESNICEAADAVDIMYAVRGKPVSPYLWFLLMTHDRKAACDDHQSGDSCRSDKANNCVWLDDMLGPSDSSAGSKDSKRPPGKTASAERLSTAAVTAAVPNLFTSRMAAMQSEFGSSLREMLWRSEAPMLVQTMETLAGAGNSASSTAGGSSTAAPAPAASSSKKSSSSGSKGGKKQLLCTSRELIDNFVYTKSGYSSVLQAPLAMHCPGSKAFNLVKCMGQTSNAACRSTPGCVVVPRVGSQGTEDLCVSDYFNKLSKDQMNKFVVSLTLAEPSVVGSCDGACWMREALLCNRTKGADDCNSLSFCRTMGDTCVPKLYNQDGFGATVQEYLGECAEVDNKLDCESKTISLVNKGKYSQWNMPARNIAECQVPNISGMLGRATAVAKEGAARLEMLTMMGAETEKQAAALAAATAAADAAKAGRILAERGVTGLQQLYARASTVLG